LLLLAAATAVALLVSGTEARQTVVAEVADVVLRAYQLRDGLLPVGTMAAGGSTTVRRGRETGCLWCGSCRLLFLRSVPAAPW
jgi:hypothetical protein